MSCWRRRPRVEQGPNVHRLVVCVVCTCPHGHVCVCVICVNVVMCSACGSVFIEYVCIIVNFVCIYSCKHLCLVLYFFVFTCISVCVFFFCTANVFKNKKIKNKKITVKIIIL